MTVMELNELDGPTPHWREGYQGEDVQFYEVVKALGDPEGYHPEWVELGVPGVDHPIIETTADIEPEDEIEDEPQIGNDPVMDPEDALTAQFEFINPSE